MQSRLRMVPNLDLVELNQAPDGEASARELVEYNDKVVSQNDLLPDFPRL